MCFFVKLKVKLAVHSSIKVNPGLKIKYWTSKRKRLMGFERMFDVFCFFFTLVNSLKFHAYLNPSAFTFLAQTKNFGLQRPDFET